MVDRIATAIGRPVAVFYDRHQNNPTLWATIGFAVGGTVVLLMLAMDLYL